MPASPRTSRPRSASWLRPRASLLALAVALAVPACGQPGSGAGSAATGAAAAPKPPPETTLFAASKPLLSDLPVTKLLPRTTTAVIAVREPAALLAKLTSLNGFGEAKDALAKEIDTFAKDLTKDLPDIAALAQSGVDLSKPVGVAWTDHSFDTAALFASVSDEPALRRWLEDRAKSSNGKREIMTVGDATVLRAKRDVTRAVVLRKGHVFWVRTRDRYDLDADRVIAAADALAKTEEAESIGADPTFGKTLGRLAFGTQAALYVNSGHLAAGLFDARKREVEAAQTALEEARAELADAEKRSRKRAAEKAKSDVEAAERRKTMADAAAKEAEVLALVKDVAPGLAAGIELGDREAQLKAFLGVTGAGNSGAGNSGAGNSGAGNSAAGNSTAGNSTAGNSAAGNSAAGNSAAAPVKLLAPLHETIALFDPAIGADAAVHFALDPRIVDLLSDQLSLRSFEWSTFPVGPARSALRDLGVEVKELEPLLDGEVSTAAHRQKVVVATAHDPAAAPPATAPQTTVDPAAPGAPASTAAPATPATTEIDGYSVMWGLSDPKAATALLEAAWKKQEATERATKGLLRRLSDASFEITPPPPAKQITRVRIAGRALLVTTLPTLADALGDGKPRTTWMTTSEHPFLNQLSGIEGATAVLAFEGVPGRRRDSWSLGDSLLGSFDIGALGGLFGPETPKSKKLREQRKKLQDQVRDLERAHHKHRDATWRGMEPRLGKTVLYAKPAEGGIVVYGGVFTPEPSLTALAEAALAAWQSAGPRWEKWGEMADLKKKIRDVDDLLDTERRKSMDKLVGDVLGGLGASDRPLGLGAGMFGRGGGRGWDDGEIGVGKMPSSGGGSAGGRAATPGGATGSKKP